MALAKRIIPCLDVMDGQTVKGVNFEQLRIMGDPVSLASYYSDQGADELVFLDITATNEKRKTMAALVKNIARSITIPFTIGGGVSGIEDVYALLQAGADKVAVNTAAVRDPTLIQRLAKEFGSQCIILAIDAKEETGSWQVYINGGKKLAQIDAVIWAQQGAALGAGEILLTSIDRDGTRNGFNIALTSAISRALSIPVIASGGAGNAAHFTEVFTQGHADAALAAGIFHSKEVTIPELKNSLRTQGITVR